MKILNALREEALQTDAYMISTAGALYTFLRQRSEVIDLRRAISNNEVTPEDITEFVQGLLKSFRPSEKFADEITLAAIAVTIRNVPRLFAEKYLRDLAELKISELPLAPRVARLCLANRRDNVISNKFAEKSFSGRFARREIPFREVQATRLAAGNDDKQVLKAVS